MIIFFAGNERSFCAAKAFHILSAKMAVFLHTIRLKMFFNDVVTVELGGP